MTGAHRHPLRPACTRHRRRGATFTALAILLLSMAGTAAAFDVGDLELPPGFVIDVYTDQVPNARQMARAGRDSRTVRRLAASLRERQLVLGVDRLDYSKGLPDRCRAFESMLTRYPETMGEVVLLQVAQPSREDVPEYAELRLELERIVGEINGRYAEFDWVPLRYLNKAYARSTVMSFLALAAVGLVTPLRDGMNLVAKEFIAAQDEDDPGVLVLSEMTGAARELDSALVVNPHDHLAVADALLVALKMPLAERRERWQAAMAVLRGNDIFNWSKRFVRELAAVRR